MEETESNGGNDLAPVAAEQLLIETLGAQAPAETVDTQLQAVLEALVYVTDEPLSSDQIASALGQPRDVVERLLAELLAEYDKPEHGVTIRQIAGGYQMGTKPEHHDAVRNFVKNLQPPMRLSMAALETLAVVAYKQPITAPEIMEIRGVQGAGVLKTLLDRRLIAAAGRKNVIGRPILYRTTKDFLVQFGLKDLGELPTLKEFEEIRRLAISDDVAVATEEQPPEEQPRQDVAEEVLSPPAEE